MTDQRCSMCGKLNPADAQVCQFCQARLKPLIITGDDDLSESTRPHSAMESSIPEEKPDWLDSLRVEDLNPSMQKKPGELDSVFDDDNRPDEQIDLIKWNDDDQEFSASLDDRLDLVSDSRYEDEISPWLRAIRSSSKDDDGNDSTLQSNNPEEENRFDNWDEFQGYDGVDKNQEDNHGDVDEDELDTKEDGGSNPSTNQNNGSAWLNEFSISRDTVDNEESKQDSEEINNLSQMKHPEPEWVPEFLSDDENLPTSDEEAIDLSVGGQRFDSKDEPIGEKTLNEREHQKDDVSGDSNDDLDDSAPDFIPDSIPPFTLDIQEYISGEFPAWLDEVPEEEVLGTDSVYDETLKDIVKADIPDWLQAMKPVASTPFVDQELDKADLMVEKEGPLAGIKGTLPVELESLIVKKKSPYLPKLQIPDKQKTEVELIEEIFEAEDKSDEIERTPIVAPQHILRITIFIILLGSVLISFLGLLPSTPIPAGSPAIFDANRMVNNIPEQTPVILALDYEPAYTGEMDAAALSVLEHLMIKDAYIVIVSTNANGPILAERLISLANIHGGLDYRGSNQYVNLGFVPGGVTGLLGFINSPKQVIQNDMDGLPAWDSPQLQAISSVSDFSLILVLADNDDIARIWIEQLSNQDNSPHLIMVLSAQAAPLVLPYYFSSPRQVEGIVSGISGGAVYETLMSKTGFATRYWDSFSTTSILGVILIVIGGLFYLLKIVFPQNKDSTTVGSR